MTVPWAAERVVTPELAQTLVEEQFHTLRPARIELVGQGFDNTAYRVNGTWIFRFPRRTMSAPLIEREVHLLPAVAPHLPLPIPIPEFTGRPSPAFPWYFAGYREIRGQTACRAGLDLGQRCALARPLARFLAALHAFPVEDAVRHGATGDEINRTNIPLRIERARGAFEELRAKGLMDAGLRRRLEGVLEAMPHEMARPAAVLVHGDLYGRHVLVDERGRATGIIDWGDVHIGDRAVDVAVACMMLPPEARDEFQQAYGAIDAETWQLAEFRTVYHAASVLRYASSVGDGDLVRESSLALRWVGSD